MASASRPPAHNLAAHPELHHLRDQLQGVLRNMTDFGPFVLKPPILASSFDALDADEDSKVEAVAGHESVAGLRALHEAVKRDLDVLEKFLADPDSVHLPALSTNAPYLIAVWNEILLAPPPIVCIWQTYRDSIHLAASHKRCAQKPPGVKIDVVAEDGRRWIRVNTIKNSRILAEFRELDSYLTDSDSESGSSHSSSSSRRPSLARTEFDNSLLRMGRSLIRAAQQNPVPGTNPPEPPIVTLRLTRLNSTPADTQEYDDRISVTIDMLQEMGIDVQLGERDITSIQKFVPTKRSLRHLVPTMKINLDLSILIALVSDITHASPPHSVEEAEARFVPPPAYVAWKRERTRTPTDAETLQGSAKHTRALASQALQERHRGFLQEIHDRLASLAVAGSPPFTSIEFWTTAEARDCCLRIVVSKIGGAGEQRRVRALFASFVDPPMSAQEAEEAYWQESRYKKGFIPLLPIRIFGADEPSLAAGVDLHSARKTGGGGKSDFSRQLADTCREILSQERTSAPPPSLLRIPASPDDGDEDDESIPPAVTTQANVKLTAHTVRSLLWGAANGRTTMTANRASVKAILREMKARGQSGGLVVATLDKEEGATDAPTGTDNDIESAAIWVVNPRSLAEGMRSDLSSTL